MTQTLTYDEIRPETRSLLTKYASVYIIVTNVCYYPIETFGSGFGPLKLIMMAMSSLLLFTYAGKFVSRALVFGVIYLLWQFNVATNYMETFRWSTLLFSCGFVFSYACMYNLIVHCHVFTIDYFLQLLKILFWAYFAACIVQQLCIIVGLRYVLWLNLIPLDRGLGCRSLSMEPSTFARTMLVVYYVFIKCSEYKNHRERYSLKELFSGEFKPITCAFLWMMLTMGSGTAFVCLIAFSGYFVTKKNALLMIPLLIALYFGLEYLPEIEGLGRATKVINALVSDFSVKSVASADGSASTRIAPLINSINADFTKYETWFGHGVDSSGYAAVTQLQATFFDDYGFIYWILCVLMTFSCAYRLFSLGAVFNILGVGGGLGGNGHYVWALAILMTCERYFYNETHAPVEKNMDKRA